MEHDYSAYNPCFTYATHCLSFFYKLCKHLKRRSGAIFKPSVVRVLELQLAYMLCVLLTALFDNASGRAHGGAQAGRFVGIALNSLIPALLPRKG